MSTAAKRLATRAIVTAIACMTGAGAASAQEYKLRYSDLGPPRGSRPQAMMWWADELKKRSEGRIEVEIFWSQALVKAEETQKAVGSGLVDTGTILGLYTPADLPVWNLANAPFGGRDVWVGMRTWQDLRKSTPALQKEAAKKNVKILANHTTGSVDILSRGTPILTAADLEGKKIRATGGWGALLKNLGATPVRVGFGEVYQALDKGTVDATINYIPAVRAYKHYEVADHITEVQMGQVLGFGMGINLRTFNGMPKDLQDILLEVSDEYVEVAARLFIEQVEKYRKELVDGIDGKKIAFHQMDEAERSKWREAGSVFVEDWIAKVEKKNIDGKKIVADLNQLRAKYEEELATKGYPWARK
ncbi:MAG: C4-dicarboxylate TRAP transporter substrate-binding protein [Burkholderiaceae bacterium]